MDTRLESLKQKIRGIEEQIEEQRKRIPPHSVKPAAIMELEALEEERDALAAEIRKIEEDGRRAPRLRTDNPQQRGATVMEDLKGLFEVGMKFHGHKCPAMPMGLRAGLAAMKALNVERAQDKELFVVAETGKGHAAGCFLDGIMTATGCTYGKSNIEKRYFNKMAFTLIDQPTGRAVRVSLKPDFFEKALASPFVQNRKSGVPPQDIAPEIADPLVDRILSMDESAFLDIGDVYETAVKKAKGIFTAKACALCGELTFVNKLRLAEDGRLVCIPCSGYAD